MLRRRRSAINRGRRTGLRNHGRNAVSFEEPRSEGSQRRRRRKQNRPQDAPARHRSPTIRRGSAIDRSGLGPFRTGRLGERRRSAIDGCRRESLLSLQALQGFLAQAAKVFRILGRPGEARLGILFQFRTSIRLGLGCHPKCIAVLPRTSKGFCGRVEAPVHNPSRSLRAPAVTSATLGNRYLFLCSCVPSNYDGVQQTPPPVDLWGRAALDLRQPGGSRPSTEHRIVLPPAPCLELLTFESKF
jgi:hypothetical protein